jgi:hypothetical protein
MLWTLAYKQTVPNLFLRFRKPEGKTSSENLGEIAGSY